ncbi:unnamed protein product [Parnassius apollo]|uniref:(apollo) hypothetical protein n=1 Tax=Parnassius apollo TaxID=110799 RepID=A0A8S3WP81_PARAO|nr:unnamed protein product [Parnassius apollo]
MTSFRKASIIAGLTLCSISDGLIFGQMSGMVDALRDSKSEIAISDNEISWIASSINATCICGLALAGLITEKVGRKRAITFLSLSVMLTWIMTYFATDLVALIASRVIVGVCYGGIIVLTYISMAEYTTPSKRAIYINIISAVGPSIGTTLGHVMSILLHWRTVALIGIIPTGLSALLPCFWVESPSWLASKGRFDECEVAFRKLHGRGDEAELELALLVNLEKTKRENLPTNKSYLIIKKIKTALKQRHGMFIDNINFSKIEQSETLVRLYKH